MPFEARSHIGQTFFEILKNLINGTKISGKKKKKNPYCSRNKEITIDAIAAMAVSGQPDHLMILFGDRKIILYFLFPESFICAMKLGVIVPG
ncbi:MAG TPA: hypothetical protein VNL34_02065 [Candidatus Nitrosotenuis sp.]|nr:hypothetical protein [Candidatus Nitrosotenuis sp.]